MRYIMVTTWSNHWDRTGNTTSFSYAMLRGAIMNPERLVDHTPTVFIRIDSTTKLPKKCWEGEVYKITRRTEKVWFEFSLDREVLCPQKYIGYPEGWYEDKTS